MAKTSKRAVTPMAPSAEGDRASSTYGPSVQTCCRPAIAADYEEPIDPRTPEQRREQAQEAARVLAGGLRSFAEWVGIAGSRKGEEIEASPKTAFVAFVNQHQLQGWASRMWDVLNCTEAEVAPGHWRGRRLRGAEKADSNRDGEMLADAALSLIDELLPYDRRGMPKDRVAVHASMPARMASLADMLDAYSGASVSEIGAVPIPATSQLHARHLHILKFFADNGPETRTIAIAGLDKEHPLLNVAAKTWKADFDDLRGLELLVLSPNPCDGRAPLWGITSVLRNEALLTRLLELGVDQDRAKRITEGDWMMRPDSSAAVESATQLCSRK